MIILTIILVLLGMFFIFSLAVGEGDWAVYSMVALLVIGFLRQLGKTHERWKKRGW